jgi:hypothetical protein
MSTYSANSLPPTTWLNAASSNLFQVIILSKDRSVLGYGIARRCQPAQGDLLLKFENDMPAPELEFGEYNRLTRCSFSTCIAVKLCRGWLSFLPAALRLKYKPSTKPG